MNGREFCFMQNVQNDLNHKNLPVVTHCGNEACTQRSHVFQHINMPMSTSMYKTTVRVLVFHPPRKPTTI